MNFEKSNPLVTVYIPTFNRVELLERAVESVRQQTYQNLEIIIVDDCSKDNTQEYLEDVSKLDTRIRYFIKDENSGACISRNIAIENARGEYVTGLDDDDYFLANRIEVFVNQMSKNKNNTFIFDNYILKKDAKNFTISRFKDKFKKKKVYAYDLLFNNYIGNQIFISTRKLKESGGFEIGMPMWQDLECWYNILSKSNGFGLNIGTYTYVQDQSHEYERISNFKKDKVLQAFSIFKKKHDLNLTEEKILYSHIYNYDFELVELKVLFLKVLLGCNVYDIKRILKKVLSF